MRFAAVISFFVSFLTALALIRYMHLHLHLSGDSAEHGPQKFHIGLTPRIGGIPIFAGLSLGMGVAWYGNILSVNSLQLWFSAIAPVFLAGMIEDITKKVSPRLRLTASFVSAALGAWLMGAVLRTVAVPGIDYLFSAFPWIALALTVLLWVVFATPSILSMVTTVLQAASP